MNLTPATTLPFDSRSVEVARHESSGAGDGDRTRDIELGKLAFYR